MRRILSVWLPHWPIECLKRRSPQGVPRERAFALVARCARGLRLTSLNGLAAAAGLRPGMALADARAVLPSLAVASAEPALDGEALVRLAAWCGRYGPRRNVERAETFPFPARNTEAHPEVAARSHGLWIDIAGVAHLFGGEAGLLANLTRRLEGLGITASLGLADTHGAAFALARHGTHDGARNGSRHGPPGVRPGEPSRGPSRELSWAIAAAGDTRDALASLPVDALRLGEETVTLLRRLGLHCIGDLYGLPRPALERRFRSGLPARSGSAKAARTAASAALMRLDQALGELGEPHAAMAEPPQHCARLAFEEPLISSEAVEALTRQLAHDLCTGLAATGQGARAFLLTLYRVDGGFERLRIATSTPCRAPEHVLRLLRERLPGLDAGFGIDVMTLEADLLEALAIGAPQLAAGPASGERDAAHLIDSLSGRLGALRVLRLTEVDGHIPERAERRVPAMEGAGLSPSRTTADTVSGSPPRDPPHRQRDSRWRPLILLPQPEAIEVLADLPDGPPSRLIWRRLARRILRAEGPERIAPEWWRALGTARAPPDAEGAATTGSRQPTRTRDYYRLEDATGARYWVFRAGHYGEEGRPPRWFVHGLYP